MQGLKPWLRAVCHSWLSPLPSVVLPTCSSWVNNITDKFPRDESVCQAGRQMIKFQSERRKIPVYKAIWLNSRKCIIDAPFLIVAHALISACCVLVMFHADHFPENSIGLNKVAFSAYFETNQFASGCFFFSSLWQPGLR